MNIYKATSDICDTTLFSLKWNKHSFGLRLAKLREAAGISARQMSLDLGLNKNYINSIESGKIIRHWKASLTSAIIFTSIPLPFSILMIIRINPSPILFHYCKS